MEEQALLDLLDSGDSNTILLALTLQQQLVYPKVEARLQAFAQALSGFGLEVLLRFLSPSNLSVLEFEGEDLVDLAECFASRLGDLRSLKQDFPIFLCRLYSFWGGGPTCEGYEWTVEELECEIKKFYLHRQWRARLEQFAQHQDLDTRIQYFCGLWVSLRSEAFLPLMQDLWLCYPNQALYFAYYLAEAAYLAGRWSEALVYLQTYFKESGAEPVALNSFFYPNDEELNPRLKRDWGIWSGLDLANFAHSVDCSPSRHGFPPNHLEAYWRMGICYEALGDLDLALEAYAKACACCPQHDFSPYLVWADLAQRLGLASELIVQARLKAWANHYQYAHKRHWVHKNTNGDTYPSLAWHQFIDKVYYAYYLGNYEKTYLQYLAFFEAAWRGGDSAVIWSYARVLLEVSELAMLRISKKEQAWFLSFFRRCRVLLSRLWRRFRRGRVYGLGPWLGFLKKFILLLEGVKTDRESLNRLVKSLLADALYFKARLLYVFYRDVWQLDLMYRRYKAYWAWGCYAADSVRFWRYVFRV